jgi:photosystem II stability/assembly factor-like uncharacterized protein
MQVAEIIRAFSRDAAFVSTPAGLLRCLESGACSRIGAFASGEASFVWASASGKEIAAVAGGKLGLSSTGGETAVWHDLPVAVEHIVWLDATGSVPGSKVYLGTSNGLFVSDDTGEHWKKAGDGLPGAQMDQWLRGTGAWVATERDGGVYLSRDQGATWTRVDHQAERSRFVGLIDAGEGAVLAGSQSEGLLRLGLGTAEQ